MANIWLGKPARRRYVLPPAFLAAQAVAIFCIIAAILVNFWTVYQAAVAVLGWVVLTGAYATWRLATRSR